MTKKISLLAFLPRLTLILVLGASLIPLVVHAQGTQEEYIPMGAEGMIGNTAPESTVPGNNVNGAVTIPANTSLGAAQQGKYTPLVNLPGLIDNDRTLGEYVNVLFRLAVGIAALIAMIKIIVAGIKYMASDAVFSKEEAKKDIQGALLGLLIILSTVVILAQINGNILNIDVLQNLQPLKQVERPVFEGTGNPTIEEQIQRVASTSGVSVTPTRNIGGTPAQAQTTLSEERKTCECKGGMLIATPTTEGSIMTCQIPLYIANNPNWKPATQACQTLLGM